ncbi:MFS transporter [Pseudonocardia acidicola]|uniref:MFS transporter n=1 Tax=Pseudonocardia acidicola TaxID=2724939 RepID=A0ABX1S6Z4_9PSEU|nr:MFS transporter [Pseudonocardia acidicola]NMH96136.1 MFS transporter [Pseudonocardia acidicola]
MTEQTDGPLRAPAQTTSRRRGVRQLLAASVGNAVEWYDWYAYSFLSAYFARQIFPAAAGQPLIPLLNTFAVFAVGFFMRPLGGLLLGSVADRIGRRGALTCTILLMGGGSLLMAVLPTYAQAGLLAPVLLVLARLIQGLSIGGEFAASTTFLVESAPPGRRGFFAGFQYVSTTIGQLLASGLTALLAVLLTADDMNGWGWRIPFAVGAVIALVGFWIRRAAEETHPAQAGLAAGRRPPLLEALRRYPRQSLLIGAVTVAGTVAYYTWTTYFPTYAQVNDGFPAADALLAGTIALTFFAVIQPLGGMLSDRYGRRPLLLVFAGGFAIGVVPLLGLIGSSWVTLLLVQCAGMVLLTGYTSIAAALNAELFPGHVRAAGIGFPYSLTVALFGGTAPYLATWLSAAGHPTWFPYYVAVLALFGFVVYWRLPETAHRPLDPGAGGRPL